MGCFSNCGSNSCWIIILLLLFCGGNDGCGNNFGGNNSCLWIILLLLFCGGNCGDNNSGYVTGNSCGCGCGGTCC